MGEGVQILGPAGSQLRPRLPTARQVQIMPRTCSQDAWGVRSQVKKPRRSCVIQHGNCPIQELEVFQGRKDCLEEQVRSAPAQLRDSHPGYGSEISTPCLTFLTAFLPLLSPSSTSSLHPTPAYPTLITSHSAEFISPGPAAVASLPW